MTYDININSNSPIGVIDSGIGGFTVVKEIVKLLPNEKIIYIGDEANFPYGEKNPHLLKKLIKSLCDYLISQDVKMIIIACNTATSVFLKKAQKIYSIPVVGVIKAGAIAAVEATKNNKIGILATTATINSNSYKNEILKLNPNLKLVNKAAPVFVQIVENNLDKINCSPDKNTLLIIDEYMKDFIKEDVDTIIMGCTHFPALIPLLKKYINKKFNYVAPSFYTALYIKNLLEKDFLLNNNKSAGKDNIFITTGKDKDKFLKFAKMILNN